MSRKKWKNRIIILVGILIILIVGIAGFLMIQGQVNAKNYRTIIQSAKKYTAGGNYEDAIVAYENAIEVIPDNDEAYIGLADLYLEQGRTSEAKITLKTGYIRTDSAKIQYMLSGIEDGSLLVNIIGHEEEEKKKAEVLGEFGWNTAFIQKLENFTYQDYQSEYGNFPDIVKVDSGEIEVVHQDLAATCLYANTKENKDIVNTRKNKPEDNSMPEKLTLDSISILFRNFTGSVSFSELQKISSGKVTPIKGEERTYVELNTGNVVARIETDENGNIVADNAWNEILLPEANKHREQKGDFSGVVISAVTGEGVPDAVLDFKAREDSLNSASTKTKSDGSFSIRLEVDVYEVTISAEDFMEETFEVEIEKDKNYSGEQFVISPDLGSGTARIVLEWGTEPKDLDSYLFGETDEGVDVNVRFSNKICKDGEHQIAELDVDETNGYGPETITIYDLNGVYRYTVADFRRTQTMKEYGATVKVYLPNQSQPTVITIDPNEDVKDIWNVLELDHGELHILNEAPAQENFTPADK